MARIALATFGSGGDLFPLIPIAAQLRDEGHEITFVVPRSLGLYTRSLGIASFSFGDGREMRVFSDARMYTNRFRGWESWRRVYDDYIAPTFEDDVARLREFFSQWKPDLIVTTSFAVPARVAAVVDRRSHVTCSIYPQHLALATRVKDNFPSRLTELLRHTLPADVLAAHRPTELVWGCDPSALLHDPTLINGLPLPQSVAAVGFPYWDQVPVPADAVPGTLEWIARSDDPVVVVTLGSFIGLRAQTQWSEALDAVERLGARALLVGAKTARVPIPEGRDDRVRATAFLPMSQILEGASVVVHHGGIGTMFATLRAGRPAVVVPQSFDQSFSAELVEGSGAGLRSDGPQLRTTIGTALRSDPIREAARRISRELVDHDTATKAASQLLAAALDAG